MNNNILHNNNELYKAKIAYILYIVIIFLQLY